MWFAPAVAVTIGIFALSTFLVVPTQAKDANNLDKIEHAFAYMVLTLSFVIAFYRTGNLTIKVAFKVFLISGGYGILMELSQYYFFEHRHFDWDDAIANFVGTAIGFLVFGIKYISITKMQQICNKK